MASTSIRIENQITSKGTVTVTQGELRGDRGRVVVLEAVPAQGYVFDKWEIETSPVQLRQFAVVGQRFDSTQNVCDSSRVDLTTPLYSDGSLLYTDSEGKYPAPVGYWQAGNGTYYFYNGTTLPSIQTCIQKNTTVESAGTGGGFTPISTGGSSRGSAPSRGFGGEFETTFEDNTRNFI